jgi:hypothetical protein
MNTAPRHVIFGTGAIGLATLDALRRRGEDVRVVNRSGTAPVPGDVEILAGDASDPAFATAAANGAQVTYQTLNPPYHQWVELFPGLQASVLAAAQATGPGWSAWRTSTCTAVPTASPSPRPAPMPPTPGKERFAPAWPATCSPPTRPAGSRSPSAGPRTTSAPAAAPSPTSATASSQPPWPARPPPSWATPTSPTPTPISPTSIPDIGEGPAVLGEHPDAPGEVWHLPNDLQTRTTRQLVDTIYQLAGQSRTKLRSTPALLLRALGVFNPTVRELLELQYEFQEPFMSTALRSPPSSMSTPPHWTRPSPTPWPATAPTPASAPSGQGQGSRTSNTRH